MTIRPAAGLAGPAPAAIGLGGATDRWVAPLLVLWSLALALWLLAGGARVTQEDGFYYFKIAQHVAEGAGSSFDGIHPTSGYHPLWLVCLVPVFWLGVSPLVALAVGTLAQALFMGLAAALVYHTARFQASGAAAGLAALLWVALVHRVSLGGMEFSLYALGLCATGYVYRRAFAEAAPRGTGPYLGLGLLLTVTFLARLEAVVLAALVGGTLVWREWRAGLTRRGAVRLAAVGLPVLVAGLTYAVLNRAWFGDPLPVSGMLKREWSASLLALDPVVRTHGLFVAKLRNLAWPLGHLDRLYPLYVALGTFGVGALWLAAAVGPREAAWRRGLAGLLRPWPPFLAFSLLTFLAYGWVYHGSLSLPTWYYAVQPWLVVMLGATLLDRALRVWQRRPKPGWRVGWEARATTLGLLILWGLVPLYTALDVQQWRDRDQRRLTPRPLHDAAEWIRANLPASAVVGAWNAGTVGYLSDRRVVNLDGVVNSWEYARTLRHDLCRYWRATGVTHLVDAFEGGRALSVVPTHGAYASCAERLELVWSDGRYRTSWRMEAYRLRLDAP